MMVETHMLKPYNVRVEQTYELMLSMLDFTEERSADIKRLRKNAVKEILSKVVELNLLRAEQNRI